MATKTINIKPCVLPNQQLKLTEIALVVNLILFKIFFITSFRFLQRDCCRCRSLVAIRYVAQAARSVCVTCVVG